MMCRVRRKGWQLTFQHVYAHNGTRGNEKADKLAKKGALKPKPKPKPKPAAEAVPQAEEEDMVN